MHQPAWPWQFVPRGEDSTLVLIPGWAFDERVFSDLELPFNYGLASWVQPDEFEARLVAFLERESLAKVTLFGWSLGAVLAAQFALAHPERVEAVQLAALRPGYAADEIKKQRQALQQRPADALAEFYRRAFLGQREDYRHFRETLEADYLQRFSRADLEEGLDFLAREKVTAEMLDAVKATVYQGERDLVAPLELVARLIEDGPHARLVSIPETGHVPFWSTRFKLLWQKSRRNPTPL